MSIEGKHAYRFIYLKSEKWQAVRLEALVREKARCQICGKESISNDAHHIWYPDSIWDTRSEQLVVLCRPCHEFIHSIVPECITSDESEGVAHWQKFYISIKRWRLSQLALFGTAEGIKFPNPSQLRERLAVLEDKASYYEWLHYASHVNFVVADPEYQI